MGSEQQTQKDTGDDAAGVQKTGDFEIAFQMTVLTEEDEQADTGIRGKTGDQGSGMDDAVQIELRQKDRSAAAG